jgi:hypothetical protein
MGYTSISVRKAFGIEYKKDLESELNTIFENAYSGSLTYG